MTLTAQDPCFEARVRASFERQAVMHGLGIQLTAIQAGQVELIMPYNPQWTQQHGYIHAGIMATALDSACGYAAFSLMPADAEVLSIEFKINLMAPARGDTFRFLGRVIKAGRTISVCEGQAWSLSPQEKLVCTMTATMMTLREQPTSG
ncbi:MAG: PaaI family thioesterase [Acidobacteria bacterium]|nr:PaaI family thioesterase [Acidobacteriota bacterium]MCB9398315.1 PaaI family thioesterase [Acidobacteriota bacterium]